MTPPPRSRKGCACSCATKRRSNSIERRLTAPGEGEVSLVLILGPQEGEVEIRLPGRYAVSAAIAGALKAAPGVVAVEQV